MPFPILDAAAAAVALLLALSIDRWWGEPPAALHPVVWMGRALGACGARVAPAQATGRDLWSFWLAAIAWCALAAIVLVVFGVLQWTAVAHLPAWGAALALGLLLKPLLAWRMLRREVLAVEAALGESLEAGRARLAWLVSRDVRQLDEAQVRESAVESLAEHKKYLGVLDPQTPVIDQARIQVAASTGPVEDFPAERATGFTLLRG